LLCASSFAERFNAEDTLMDERYNHAPNDSPRSGGSKKVTPVVWGVIVAMMVALAIWFTMKA
jgi:hypothetical protein